VATFFLVLLTLFGALPIYSRVAEESPHGEGSISMLEHHLSRWKGKLFVLVLFGFVATDVVITITLGRRSTRVASHEEAKVRQLLRGRIHNAQKLLRVAALIMSVMLISSSFVTAILIPAEKFAEGQEVNGRAIAYLAHEFFGNIFGTVYDLSTILILWFAGASATAS
jgi:amino acid permease